MVFPAKKYGKYAGLFKDVVDDWGYVPEKGDDVIDFRYRNEIISSSKFKEKIEKAQAIRIEIIRKLYRLEKI